MADTQPNVLQLRITGDIQPQRLRAKDLSEVISAYEDAIAAVVARRHPALKPVSIVVGLVEVGGGSVALRFDASFPEVVYPAALAITRAVASATWAELPLRAVKPLRALVQFLRQRDLSVHFHTGYGAETASAVITKSTEIPPGVSPVKAFAAIREQFGAYFDQIEDPNEWAAQARQG